MRWAALILVLAITTAVAWTLRPQPAAACSCGLPALHTELEPIDGSTTATSMCLITLSSFNGTTTVFTSCDAVYVFDDEIFRGQR